MTQDDKDQQSPPSADATSPVAPAGAPPQGAAAQATQPQVGILSQYIKDLSFENPGAPNSLQVGGEPPEIKVSVQVNARPLQTQQGELYEVSLQVLANAQRGDTSVFLVELVYGGVFTIMGVPAESLQPVLLVECPRLIFPFARRVLSDVTRDGGFPPLLLNPIDFVALYRQQLEQSAAAGQGAQAAQAASPSANA